MWRKSSQRSLQVRREARRMEKARSSTLTMEGAFIQKAHVWEDNLMKWLFFWRNITFLHLLVQGRMNLKKKMKNTKGKAMHWRLAAHEHMSSSLILELPTIWPHPVNQDQISLTLEIQYGLYDRYIIGLKLGREQITHVLTFHVQAWQRPSLLFWIYCYFPS